MPFDATPTIHLRARPNCLLCPASVACLSGAVSREDATRWNGLVEPHAPLFPEGGALFSAGMPASMLYVVRAGCIKSYTVDADGNERVRAFHLPGDIVGLDALGSQCYPGSAAAVVPSQVCAIPRARMLELMASSPLLMRGLLERAARDLSFALAIAGDYTAEQRVAAFLLHMNSRLGCRPGENERVRLPMTRREMGSFLRLATETVCRVLTRLEKQGAISLRDKAIHLVAPQRLGRMAAPVGLAAEESPMRRAA